jgi:hypothetical protein
MTIAAAYLTSEGVVLGADSTSSIVVPAQDGEGHQVVQLFNHAQKIFEVGKPHYGRIAICTWGAGSLKNMSHRTLIAQLADKIKDDTKIETAVAEFAALIAKNRSDPALGLGYFVGGCNPGDHSPECWKLWFKGADEIEQTKLVIGEACFEGAPEYFCRIFRGYSPQLPDALYEQLHSELPTLTRESFADAFVAASKPLVSGGFNDLPVREAIDYIHTYLHITIKAVKFKFGPPVCGGPIEIAFVSTDRRFRWIRHKGFDSAICEATGRFE